MLNDLLESLPSMKEISGNSRRLSRSHARQIPEAPQTKRVRQNRAEQNTPVAKSKGFSVLF